MHSYFFWFEVTAFHPITVLQFDILSNHKCYIKYVTLCWFVPSSESHHKCTAAVVLSAAVGLKTISNRGSPLPACCHLLACDHIWTFLAVHKGYGEGGGRQARKWISVPISSRAPRLRSQEDFLTQCSTNWWSWRSSRVIRSLRERDITHLSAQRVPIQRLHCTDFPRSKSSYTQPYWTLRCSFICEVSLTFRWSLRDVQGFFCWVIISTSSPFLKLK